ncbi:unnamed protein product [Angiostrongylus costaricensis]|uniref:C2H2-type domain-containing protein n=1 Tax=Angiostrongylus costaricensis TaxID=334426 RepID=A0A158PL54_ANGCS|nr:unnamed protein product [Angiostrongylus costaricensis]
MGLPKPNKGDQRLGLTDSTALTHRALANDETTNASSIGPKSVFSVAKSLVATTILPAVSIAIPGKYPDKGIRKVLVVPSHVNVPHGSGRLSVENWSQKYLVMTQFAEQMIDAGTVPISPFSGIAVAAQPLSSSTSKIDDSSIFSPLGPRPDTTTSSYIPTINVSGIAAPIPKRPRLMLPVVNEERQLSVLQSRADDKPSCVVNNDLPQPNIALMPAAFTAFRTSAVSPATETPVEPRCSSSTSVDTLSNSKEEEEPELFIDIESVDNRPEGRDRRRAYIEFYRKVKSARQREPGPLLSCALCDCQILSNDNSIHTHVNHHADAGGFWCKLCGVNEVDKYRIYEHMRVNHPNNMELFEDRRDIIKLCAVIQECFPRTFPRSKKDVARGFDIIIKCKVCKFVSENQKAQEDHQVEVHSVADPKNMVNYNVCGTADILAKIVQRCFAYIVRPNDSTNSMKNPNQKN